MAASKSAAVMSRGMSGEGGRVGIGDIGWVGIGDIGRVLTVWL